MSNNKKVKYLGMFSEDVVVKTLVGYMLSEDWTGYNRLSAEIDKRHGLCTTNTLQDKAREEWQRLRPTVQRIAALATGN